METLLEVVIIETCCSCGVTFGFTQGYKSQRLKDGKTFYCPNGHAQIYSNNDAKKLEDTQKAFAKK